jgi:hypothetical protein
LLTAASEVAGGHVARAQLRRIPQPVATCLLCWASAAMVCAGSSLAKAAGAGRSRRQDHGLIPIDLADKHRRACDPNACCASASGPPTPASFSTRTRTTKRSIPAGLRDHVFILQG